MWSVVEKTALAEAEVEYADIEVDTIFVKFPIRFVVRSGAKMTNLLDCFSTHLDNNAMDDSW